MPLRRYATWFREESMSSLLSEMSSYRHNISEGNYHLGSAASDAYDGSLGSSSSTRRILRAFQSCDRYYKEGPEAVEPSSLLYIQGQPVYPGGHGFVLNKISTPLVDFSLVGEVVEERPEPSLIWIYRPNGNVFIQEYIFRKDIFAIYAIRKQELEALPHMLDIYDSFAFPLTSPGMMFRGIPICTPKDSFLWQKLINKICLMVRNVTDDDGFLVNEYEPYQELFASLPIRGWWEDPKVAAE